MRTTPRPGFVRLASGPARAIPPLPAIGADIVVRMGHRIRGRVLSVVPRPSAIPGDEADGFGHTITCQYMGMEEDPADMIRPVWIDAGANYGLKPGDTFTTCPHSIATGPAKPFKL